ncbi:hypothetical protein D3C75_702770 [compost metagenome]
MPADFRPKLRYPGLIRHLPVCCFTAEQLAIQPWHIYKREPFHTPSQRFELFLHDHAAEQLFLPFGKIEIPLVRPELVAQHFIDPGIFFGKVKHPLILVQHAEYFSVLFCIKIGKLLLHPGCFLLLLLQPGQLLQQPFLHQRDTVGQADRRVIAVELCFYLLSRYQHAIPEMDADKPHSSLLQPQRIGAKCLKICLRCFILNSIHTSLVTLSLLPGQHIFDLIKRVL